MIIYAKTNISERVPANKSMVLQYIGEGDTQYHHSINATFTWGRINKGGVANVEIKMQSIEGPMKIVIECKELQNDSIESLKQKLNRFVVSIKNIHVICNDKHNITIHTNTNKLLTIYSVPLSNIQINIRLSNCSDVQYVAKTIEEKILEYVKDNADSFILVNV